MTRDAVVRRRERGVVGDGDAHVAGQQRAGLAVVTRNLKGKNECVTVCHSV